MNGRLHPKADVDRIYVHREQAGHGILTVEDILETAECTTLYHYLKSHPDALMTQVFSGGIVKPPHDLSIAPETLKDQLNASHFQT